MRGVKWNICLENIPKTHCGIHISASPHLIRNIRLHIRNSQKLTVGKYRYCSVTLMAEPIIKYRPIYRPRFADASLGGPLFCGNKTVVNWEMDALEKQCQQDWLAEPVTVRLLHAKVRRFMRCRLCAIMRASLSDESLLECPSPLTVPSLVTFISVSLLLLFFNDESLRVSNILWTRRTGYPKKKSC